MQVSLTLHPASLLSLASLHERRCRPNREEEKKRDNGNDRNEPPDLHPFVQGLLKELPKAGDVWSEEKRKLWLDTAASIFKMIYKDTPIPPPPGDAEYRKAQGLPSRGAQQGGLIK